MSAAQYCGLTWDHPRGYNALAAAAEASGGLLHWDKQPLEGFESHPIGELAGGATICWFSIIRTSARPSRWTA